MPPRNFRSWLYLPSIDKPCLYNCFHLLYIISKMWTSSQTPSVGIIAEKLLETPVLARIVSFLLLHSWMLWRTVLFRPLPSRIQNMPSDKSVSYFRGSRYVHTSKFRLLFLSQSQKSFLDIQMETMLPYVCAESQLFSEILASEVPVDLLFRLGFLAVGDPSLAEDCPRSNISCRSLFSTGTWHIYSDCRKLASSGPSQCFAPFRGLKIREFLWE